MGKAKRAHQLFFRSQWWARRKRAFAHPTRSHVLRITLAAILIVVAGNIASKELQLSATTALAFTRAASH